MGVKSTHHIKKEVALNIILSKVHSCTDKELEDILECFKESTYRNYIISDDPYHLSIDSVESFNEEY